MTFVGPKGYKKRDTAQGGVVLLSPGQLEHIVEAVEAQFAPKFEAIALSLSSNLPAAAGSSSASVGVCSRTEEDNDNGGFGGNMTTSATETDDSKPSLIPVDDIVVDNITKTIETRLAPRFQAIETSISDIQKKLELISSSMMRAQPPISVPPPIPASCSMPEDPSSEPRAQPVPPVPPSRNTTENSYSESSSTLKAQQPLPALPVPRPSPTEDPSEPSQITPRNSSVNAKHDTVLERLDEQREKEEGVAVDSKPSEMGNSNQRASCLSYPKATVMTSSAEGVAVLSKTSELGHRGNNRTSRLSFPKAAVLTSSADHDFHHHGGHNRQQRETEEPADLPIVGKGRKVDSPTTTINKNATPRSPPRPPPITTSVNNDTTTKAPNMAMRNNIIAKANRMLTKKTSTATRIPFSFIQRRSMMAARTAMVTSESEEILFEPTTSAHELPSVITTETTKVHAALSPLLARPKGVGFRRQVQKDEEEAIQRLPFEMTDAYTSAASHLQAMKHKREQRLLVDDQGDEEYERDDKLATERADTPELEEVTQDQKPVLASIRLLRQQRLQRKAAQLHEDDEDAAPHGGLPIKLELKKNGRRASKIPLFKPDGSAENDHNESRVRPSSTSKWHEEDDDSSSRMVPGDDSDAHDQPVNKSAWLHQVNSIKTTLKGDGDAHDRTSDIGVSQGAVTTKDGSCGEKIGVNDLPLQLGTESPRSLIPATEEAPVVHFQNIEAESDVSCPMDEQANVPLDSGPSDEEIDEIICAHEASEAPDSNDNYRKSDLPATDDNKDNHAHTNLPAKEHCEVHLPTKEEKDKLEALLDELLWEEEPEMEMASKSFLSDEKDVGEPDEPGRIKCIRTKNAKDSLEFSRTSPSSQQMQNEGEGERNLQVPKSQSMPVHPDFQQLRYRSRSFPAPRHKVNDDMMGYLEVEMFEDRKEDKSYTSEENEMEYSSQTNSILETTGDEDSRPKKMPVSPKSQPELKIIALSPKIQTKSTGHPGEIILHQGVFLSGSPTVSAVSNSSNTAQTPGGDCGLSSPRQRGKSSLSPSSNLVCCSPPDSLKVFAADRNVPTKEEGLSLEQIRAADYENTGTIVWSNPKHAPSPYHIQSSEKPFIPTLDAFPHSRNPTFAIIAQKIAEAEAALKTELARDGGVKRDRTRRSDLDIDEFSDPHDKMKNMEIRVPAKVPRASHAMPKHHCPTTTILTDSDDRYIELVHVGSGSLFDLPSSPTSEISLDSSLKSFRDKEEQARRRTEEVRATVMRGTKLSFLERFRERHQKIEEGLPPCIAPTSSIRYKTQRERGQIMPSTDTKESMSMPSSYYNISETSSYPETTSSSIDLALFEGLHNDDGTEQDTSQIYEIVKRYYHYHNLYNAGIAEHFEVPLEQRLQQPLDQLLSWTMAAFEEIEKDFLMSFEDGEEIDRESRTPNDKEQNTSSARQQRPEQVSPKKKQEPISAPKGSPKKKQAPISVPQGSSKKNQEPIHVPNVATAADTRRYRDTCQIELDDEDDDKDPLKRLGFFDLDDSNSSKTSSNSSTSLYGDDGGRYSSSFSDDEDDEEDIQDGISNHLIKMLSAIQEEAGGSLNTEM